MEIIKQSSLMGELKIREVSYELAKEMILEKHYSHKWNTSFGKVNIGIFRGDSNNCLGVASFGNLMNPKSFKQFNDDFEQNSIIELNRLWIDDELGKNAETILLGASWRIIRENYPHIKAVQSFADGRLGCGTIYKAANFKYYGYTKTLFYEDIETGITYHKVPMENTMRPNGLIKLNVLFSLGRLRPFYVKTYKYVYILYKNVKLKMKDESYPEYDKGEIPIDDYKHNKSIIFRSIVLSYLLGQKDDFMHLFRYVKNNYNILIINKEFKDAFNNKSIIRITESKKLEERLLFLKDNFHSWFDTSK